MIALVVSIFMISLFIAVASLDLFLSEEMVLSIGNLFG